MAQFESTNQLIAKLRSVLIRQRIILSMAGLMTTLAAVVVAWVGLTLLANVWVLPVWFKISLLVLVAVGTVYIFGRFALARFLDGNIDAVALTLEDKNPALKGRLIAAVQFEQEEQPVGYSVDLIRAAKKQALDEAGHIEFGEATSLFPLWKTGKQLLAASLLAVLMLALAPGFFGYAFEVYSNPATRIAPAVAYQLTCVPGTTEWVKYRDITVGAFLFGERFPEKASVHHRLAGGSWQTTDVDLKALVPITTVAGDSLSFGITFPRADRSFDYYVQAGERRSEVYQVNIVDRPRVTGINLSIFYPDYTGLSPLTIDENNGSFSAVVGSRVNMKIDMNLPVEKADFVIDDDSRISLEVNGKSAETSLRIDKSFSYHVRLLDHLGEQNPDPIEYYVTAIPDEFPSVDVIRPGYDVNLNDEMLLPLLVRIYDDYGFTSLVMKYTLISQGRAGNENVAVLHFSDKIKTEGDIDFNWDMDVLGMFPGDYVTYYFEVADNDAISGPKISRSRKYLARLPSLEEIIAQVEKESTQRITDVEEMVKAGKELSRRLKEAARKMESQSPTGPTADWQEQKELEAIARQNQEMTDQVQKLAEQMDKSLDQMRDNSLMSREVMDKLQEIQKLFEEVATEEMREAQKKMAEALKEMDPDKLAQAMEDFEMSQEELLQRLERTLALLKQMQIEAKMEAMIRKVEDLVKKQDKVNEDTDNAADQALPDLSQAEDDNVKAMQALKKETAELKEMFKEAGMDEIAEAQKFAEALEKSDADQDMQQMSQSLKDQQQSKASAKGKLASSKLMAMLDQMQQAQMAMNQDDSEEIKRRMKRAMGHSSNLSIDQEDMIREIQEIDPTSVVIRDMASAQQDLALAGAGLHKAIAELGKISPFIAAELESLVNHSVQSMEMATTEFENKRGIEGQRYQRDAMVNLNRATLRLMESMDEMNQCENASNCDKGMAKMESLSKKQQQLNKASQGMCDNPGQGNKPSSKPGGEQLREGLERLAGEQGAIRKSMQELEKEFGGSRQILGRLSDIANEMKKVEEELRSGDVGPETLERQLKIYSRMLEASRSLQRKDFTERRQAASATSQPVLIPPELPQNLLDDRIDLEDRLRQFLGDNYPPQYEEQIKAYFRALLKAQAEIQNQYPTSGGGR